MLPGSRSVLRSLPADLIAAVEADAARDADHVGTFLAELGLRASPDKPITLPVRFLLNLAAALRLCDWEAQGYSYHLQGGLPRATVAINDALSSLVDPGVEPTGLADAVLGLCIERFAWNGRPLLGADIALDELSNPALLDALAEFLWASRHDVAETPTVRP
jgi:hypothetical protein